MIILQNAYTLENRINKAYDIEEIKSIDVVRAATKDWRMYHSSKIVSSKDDFGRVVMSYGENKDIIIEVDVNGAGSIKEKLTDAVSIFIMPPSFAELKRRLSSRGTETDEVIALRLSAALSEIKRAIEYDYIVVNDDLSTAVEDIIAIIKGSKFCIKRQKHIIDEVLKNVKP